MSQRTWSSLVSLGALSLALGGFLLACGGQQKPKEQLNAEMKGLPKWALGKCREGLKNKDALCGSGSVQGMSNVSLARSAAEGRARTELARTLQVRVKAMLKDPGLFRDVRRLCGRRYGAWARQPGSSRWLRCSCSLWRWGFVR